MKIREIFLKVAIAVSILTVGSISALAGYEDNCAQLMYDHGLASGAQFTCGFEFYNDNIISRASQCMAVASEYGKEDKLSEALEAGLKDFHYEYENADSKYKLCSDFAKNFSSFVQP